MKIGISSINDKNLKKIIEKINFFGISDITHRVELIYDTEKNNIFQDLFISLFDVFSVSLNNEGLYLYEYFKIWGTFNVDEIRLYKIIEELFKEKIEDEPDLLKQNLIVADSSVFCIVKNNLTWKDFSDSIKKKNRYHSHYLINEDNLAKFFDTLLVNDCTNDKLFRARICSANDKIGFNVDDMGFPPFQYSKAGRISPEGIPCLYLASEENTCLSECRAKNYDRITIGTFRKTRSIHLIDFTILDDGYLSPFGMVDQTFIISNFETIKEIISELRRPLRPYESSIDYIPTQFICDFIKATDFNNESFESIKCDGIKYRSTLDKKGINYAIFAKDAFLCEKVVTYDITVENKYTKTKL